MKFVMEKDCLLSALNIVEKFVPSKSPIPLLSGIRFIASNDFLSLSATDIDLGIEHKIPIGEDDGLVKIMETGSAVFPARIFSEIARKMPVGEAEFSYADSRVEITAGGFRMNLPCFDALDFPEITKEELLPTMNFSQKLFKNMIKQTAFARAEESTSRPQLTGILVERRSDMLHMVALDGFRIAWRKENLDKDDVSESKDFSLIIPGRTLMEVMRIFGEGEEFFNLYAGKNRLEIRTENTVISSRLLEGNFINYEQVTNVEPQTTVDIDVDQISSALDRGLTLAREGSKNNLIKFRISQDNLEVSADTEMGNLNDRLSCRTQGEDLLIAFNARFLMDALRSVETPEVQLAFSGESGPCIMRPVGIENHINFVLPVKMRGEDY